MLDPSGLLELPPDRVIATVRASPPRRWFGVAVIGTLAVLLLYVAFDTPPAHPGWTAFLVVLGGFSLFAAWKLHEATSHALELTRDELRIAGGEVLARVDDIVDVQRGMLAFKPSNGFVVKLARPAPPMFRPGLCWRIGRTLAIGGALPGGQTKFMADMIALLIAARQEDAGAR